MTRQERFKKSSLEVNKWWKQIKHEVYIQQRKERKGL